MTVDWARLTNPARGITYEQQRNKLLSGLAAKGWAVQTRDARTGAPLKVPYATSPSGRTRLWFKSQAIYYNFEGGNDLHAARSLSTDMKRTTVEQLVIATEWHEEQSRAR